MNSAFSKILMSVFSIGLFASSALAVPAQVIIVRHGEKVTDADTELSPQGQKRAELLVGYVTSNPYLNAFGAPAAVYAAQPKADHSTRAAETAAPLAKALGQPLRLDFGKDDEKVAARSILRNPEFNGKTVFIAWVHDEIPKLANAFGVSDPPDWKGKNFDRTWVIRFGTNGDVSSAFEINQALISTDAPMTSPRPISGR